MAGTTVSLREVRASMGAVAAGFDPALVSISDAARVVEDAAAVEKMAATVKALAAARVAEANQWKSGGHRSAESQLAKLTGTSVGAARDAIAVGQRLAELPEIAAAARAGELSAPQAALITDAAVADPSAERRLLDQARNGASLPELRDEVLRTKAAVDTNPEATRARIHRNRFARSATKPDGTWRLEIEATTDYGAEFMALADAECDKVFKVAREEGRRETHDAYMADAILNVMRRGGTTTSDAATEQPASLEGPAAGGSSKPGLAGLPAKVLVRIDLDTFLRGYPIGGEVCEVAGMGPIPVSVVQAMLASGNSFLAAIFTRGTQVQGVVHFGRKPTAHQLTALQWMMPTCTRLGCPATDHLEVDHRHDWADTKVTIAEWLDPLCGHDHDLKTHHGWALVPGTGKRPLVPPDDPRHPRNINADQHAANAPP